MFSYGHVICSVNLVASSRGRKVTSLGVLFDFTGGDKGTSVQKVADMINEKWVGLIPHLPLVTFTNLTQFSEAIKEEPDVFLLAG